MTKFIHNHTDVRHRYWSQNYDSTYLYHAATNPMIKVLSSRMQYMTMDLLKVSQSVSTLPKSGSINHIKNLHNYQVFQKWNCIQS